MPRIALVPDGWEYLTSPAATVPRSDTALMALSGAELVRRH
jgi:hypothetical protein